ncbi:MAG: hypothetical protein HZB54_03865 [Deltaproteobacteria bacterium]|nr:hypothetical protein [Deltaproteobacteria bacterium]
MKKYSKKTGKSVKCPKEGCGYKKDESEVKSQDPAPAGLKQGSEEVKASV